MALTLVTSDLIHGLDYSKLTGTIPTWNQNTTGNADTATLAAGATILATARNIGGVSFNGSAAINLPGVNTAGNQNTSGNAGTVTNGVYTVGNQTIGGAKTFSSAATLNMAYNGGSTGMLNLVSTGAEAGMVLKNSSGDGFKVGASGTSFFIYDEESNHQPLTILANSKVGIGTTLPTNLLHLAGASSTPSLRLASTSVGYHWDIGRENATTGDFVFINTVNNGTPSEKMRISSNGKVGIGTGSTAPQNNLTIQTATDVRVGIYGGVGYSGIQSISDNNNVWKSLRLDGSDIEFRIQNVPKLTISSTGAATFSGNVTATGGYYYGQTTNSFVRLDNAIGSQIGYNNYAYSLYDSNGVSFYTASNATPTLKLKIRPSGKITFDNNERYIEPAATGDIFKIAQNQHANGMQIGMESGTAFNPSITIINNLNVGYWNYFAKC